MGAGRYNQASRNHNGEHTGIGKKQKTGVYYRNGKYYKIESHTKFMMGDKVYNKKTGEIGIVIKNNKKDPRSMIQLV